MDLHQLKIKFQSSGIVEQLIYINVGVFILTFIGRIFNNMLLFEWFSLPANGMSFIEKPWTVISYGFLHSSFLHLLSNVLGLYYFGNLFLDFFSKKQVILLYILGTICGGSLYLLSFNLFDQLDNNSIMVGSSAAVSALLIGISTYMPNFKMRFALIGGVKLWHIAIFWVSYNLLFITANNNLGGNIAHLGGALFGFIYVYKVKSLQLSIFNFKIPFFKTNKKPLRTVHNSSNKSTKVKQTATKSSDQQKIDSILDKIGKSGYDSLSKNEKDFLFRQGSNS